MLRKAIFLDRDGTLITDVGYLSQPDQIQLLPGAVEAVKQFNDAGYLVILITNQSGVARGFFPESRIADVHERLRLMLGDAKLDAVYYCPHGPEDGCDCRKPKPGMLLRAAAEWNIDLNTSLMIGDKEDDVIAGNAAGCGAVRFRNWEQTCDELKLRIR